MVESKPKNLGRAYLVGKLRKRDLSRRDSVRILKFVIDEMTQALTHVLCSMSLALRGEAPRFARAAGGADCSSRRPSGNRRSAPCRPQTSNGASTPSRGAISCAERPVTTTMRVRS